MTDQEFLKKLKEMIRKGLIIVFDEDRSSVKSVEDVHMNGKCYQLNVERWEDAI